MSVITARPPQRNYLNTSYTARSWLLSTDHKRIAILYMVSLTLFFVIGGAAATLIRLNLVTPDGLLVGPETYNKLFTMHGVIMVWFFLIPSIPNVLGNVASMQRRAVESLPAEEREVVRLQHFEGLTHAQIADRLQVAAGTVKSRSFRAHRRLAAALGYLRGTEARALP